MQDGLPTRAQQAALDYYEAKCAAIVNAPPKLRAACGGTQPLTLHVPHASMVNSSAA